MSSTTVRSDIVETCARRGIARVVHCHADHFEPEEVAKRLGAAADIAPWMERCKPAVPTLFVKCPLGFRLDTSSDIGMSLRLNSSAAIEADYLRTLAGLGAGIALHVHHEAWTRNTMAREKLSAGQLELHDLVMTQDGSRDHARMGAMVEASLAWMREVTGMSLSTWHFVHGCWSFGASDPEICQLTNELPLLFGLGCRADFSFPAGRRYCDPPWDRPKWVVPAQGVWAFDQPAADPRDEYGDDRLLVWASQADEWWCGLDTYSIDSRKLTESTTKIERYLKLCPVIGGTAYVKTCGHGMHPHYWQDGPTPTLGAFASELAAKLAAAGVPVEFLTTDQMMATVIGSQHGQPESAGHPREG